MVSYRDFRHSFLNGLDAVAREMLIERFIVAPALDEAQAIRLHGVDRQRVVNAALIQLRNQVRGEQLDEAPLMFRTDFEDSVDDGSNRFLRHVASPLCVGCANRPVSSNEGRELPGYGSHRIRISK